MDTFQAERWREEGRSDCIQDRYKTKQNKTNHKMQQQQKRQTNEYKTVKER